MAAEGVFVFSDGGVEFFRSVDEAAGDVEAIDVQNGEYEAFFTLSGLAFQPVILDETRVELRPSAIADLDALRRLLRREQIRYDAFRANPDDPVAVANEFLLRRWTHRWPKWPRWLDRRLHGERAPQI